MPRARRILEPPIYVFRVRILGGFYAPPDARSIWREIAVASNQTLGDLGKAIPLAFGFDDPHMWSFFLSGKPWDTASEYALYPDDVFGSKRGRAANRARIRDLPFPGKTGKKEFLFVFDYGDEWHFGVKLLRQNPTVDPVARYPQIVAREGANPPQYPDYPDDDEGEEDGEFVIIQLDETGIHMIGRDAFRLLDGKLVRDDLDDEDKPHK